MLSVGPELDPTESLFKADNGRFLYVCLSIVFSSHSPYLPHFSICHPLMDSHSPAQISFSLAHTLSQASGVFDCGSASVLCLLRSWVGFRKTTTSLSLGFLIGNSTYGFKIPTRSIMGRVFLEFQYQLVSSYS